MVAPVTGPFNETISFGNFYSSKSRWRQKLPYNQPLPYSNRVALVKQTQGSIGLVSPVQAASSYWGNDARVAILSQCYARLVGKLGDRASLGVDLAQIGQSLSMIEQRALHLVDFSRKIRRMDFKGAARVLGMSVVPPKVGYWQSYANNWLEFYFGWRPMVMGIQAAVSVLSKPQQNVRIKASASGPYDFKESHFTQWGSLVFSDSKVVSSKITCKMACTVSVINPNIVLANRLGLANPLMVAYEVIPWSFLSNWFFNVEQYLSMGTDFYGLSVADAFTTWYQVGTQTYGSYNPYDSPPGNACVAEYMNMSRELGLTLPSLHLKPYKPPNWGRAATAIALLVQQLPGSTSTYSRHLR